ncbi:MAG: 2Fe-2S iron-sulfur cluster binding domain-containing protein [Pseudolabrys sp.]|nr:2Fe-2S iron-sulfur cluster binding domain-containing protein [Pseudolabrys sp.]
MKTFEITINGDAVQAKVEPRMHLADFLRDEKFLTGTHIGCEHGVCGACTVLIDGCPARSCITFAVACEGAKVSTIEGLRDDPVMVELREAFSAHHALQCGYCTPGMLISCRDIVLRLPDADEKRIRLELSGNLCRCTGYVGIVAAVKEILAKRRGAGSRAFVPRNELGPIGAHAPSAHQSQPAVRRPKRPVQMSALGQQETFDAERWQVVESDGVELKQTFSVGYSSEKVWDFFKDLDRVARCMPGARLTKPPVNDRAEGEVKVKLGPIVSAFDGAVDVKRDDRRLVGTVRGAGRDAKSGSNARAIITYHVNSTGDDSSQVDISVKFLLTGALAQFGRSGLVKDVADHLTALFAGNLEACLSGRTINEGAGAPLDAASLARTALWNRIRSFFSILTGKGTKR